MRHRGVQAADVGAQRRSGDSRRGKGARRHSRHSRKSYIRFPVWNVADWFTTKYYFSEYVGSVR